MNTYTERHSTSPEKQMVRSRAYASLGKDVLYNSYHIVIAGACGDLKYFDFIDIDKSHVVVCDTDEQQLRLAHSMGYNTRHESIVDTVKYMLTKHSENELIVNLDLCGTLKTGIPILQKIEELLPNCLRPIFFTFMRGMKDGFKSSDERMDYLHAHSKNDWRDFPYQSYTRTDPIGSPMTLAVSNERKCDMAKLDKKLNANEVLKWLDRSARRSANFTAADIASHFDVTEQQAVAFIAVLSGRKEVSRNKDNPSRWHVGRR